MLMCRRWMKDNHLISAAFSDTRQGMDQQPKPHFNIGGGGDSQPMDHDGSDSDMDDDNDSDNDSYHSGSDSDYDPEKTFETFVGSIFSDDEDSSGGSTCQDSPDIQSVPIFVDIPSPPPLFQSRPSTSSRRNTSGLGLALDDSMDVEDFHAIRIYNRNTNGAQANMCWMDCKYFAWHQTYKNGSFHISFLFAAGIALILLIW